MESKVASVVLAALVVVPTVLLGASPAVASDDVDPGDRIDRYDLTVDLDRDGVAQVDLVLDVDFGSRPNHGPYLTYVVKQPFEPEGVIDDAPPQDRVYRMSDIRAVGPGDSPTEVEVEEEGALLVLKIGDEDAELTGQHTYRVTFQVEGWVNSSDLTGADHDELDLNVLGGWQIPVDDVTVTITGPSGTEEASCRAGTRGATSPCTSAAVEGGSAVYTQEHTDPGHHLTVLTTFPAGTFGGVQPILQDRWELGRAFSVTPVTGGAAALIVGLGGLWLARRARRTGRDDPAGGRAPGLVSTVGAPPPTGLGGGTAPAALQYQPPAGFRPGQLGTLIDERADAHDVTATLIDLAVRGHLRIEQTAAPDDDGSNGEWRLVRTRDVPAVGRPHDHVLLPYEELLLDEVFETGDSVDLMALRETFAKSMAKVQDALYEDVTQRGWFRGNPKATRTAWALGASALLLLGVVVTTALAIWTTWALVGVPLVLLGIAALVMTGSAPARTTDGTAVLTQARGFRDYLATVAADQLQLERDEDLFSRHLPYAVAFGLTERWAGVFADVATRREVAIPTWYVGAAYGPAFWASSGAFGRDLTAFTTTASHALAAPTPSSSGSTGGSFAGGGVGGGGGGTW